MMDAPQESEEKMELYRKQVEESADFVRSHINIRPEIAIVLGTGLGGIADAMKDVVILPYETIPHYPVSTVTSHQGRLLCGEWGGKPVIAMQGRFHLYEGYSPHQIAFPIRVFAALGIRTLILSNAAGGLNPQYSPGDLMIITDHINLTGHSPLVGPNVEAWGPRFPDMTEPYDRKLQVLALETAVFERVPIHRGVYVGVLGPHLETAAETRFLRTIGADAVGMSTIMEVITAVHAGIKVLGISAISNLNLPDCYKPVTIEEVIATVEKAGSRLTRLLARIVERME